jgi:hypothetical protein
MTGESPSEQGNEKIDKQVALLRNRIERLLAIERLSQLEDTKAEILDVSMRSSR